ncbi:MAG: type II secretion system GspH family protein [Colwellia sp.]|nr:type II secretion system GspH family protein [Colwellia sp.]
MKTRYSGFTLIEVIVVMILIGTLAVAAISKFSGSDSFEAYTYRTSLISALRLTQQRAMQQTDEDHCHQIIFETKRYGIPDRTDCTEVDLPDPPDEFLPDKTGLDFSDTSVTVNIKDGGNIVSFDSMGRPGNDCGGGCIINVGSAVETVQIEIESEGYIHGI